MSTFGLEPYIQVDGEDVYIIPGTWSFTAGYPEITTKAISFGRANTKLYRTQDTSTAYSTFKFDMPSTPEAIQMLQRWKARTGNFIVVAIDKVNNDEVELTFTDCSIDNNPDVESGSDAKISIEGTAERMIQI